MTREELGKLIELTDRRNEKLYAWLRHLMLLAGGALTVLVSLDAGGGSSGAALLSLRVAWTGLGAGILLGSISLYAEVWQPTSLVVNLAAKHKEHSSRQKGGGPSETMSEPVVSARPPWWMRCAERGCYGSLAIAVVFLVVFAWLR